MHIELRQPAANGTAKLVAAVVAGSGLLNLLSLLNSPVPAGPPGWLRGLFPLEFTGVSSLLTLVSGFVLILAAIHLWAGKRRAWRLSLALACASAFLHLLKGPSVEEAVCSALVAVLLWFTRRQFRIGAGPPQLQLALLRAGVAFAAGICYGLLGYRVLMPGKFHLHEAAARSVQLMLFLGGDGPAWFVDSFYWLSAAAFLYAGFVLFRPVAYRFRLDEEQAELAGRIAGEHGHTALDFFKHWPDKSYFFSSTGASFLSYRVAGAYALALGDPVGPEDDRERAIAEFVAFCQKRGWRIGFHQVGEDCLPVYQSLGFRRLKLGDEAIVDLCGFTLEGSARKEFRNTITRLERLGYRVQRFNPPLSEPLLGELK